jgi:hypothetical protein
MPFDASICALMASTAAMRVATVENRDGEEARNAIIPSTEGSNKLATTKMLS